MKKFLSVLLVVCLVLGASALSFAAPTTDERLEQHLQATLATLLLKLPNPTFGGQSEWDIMTLARSGHAVPEGYYEGYYASVVAKLKESDGKLAGNHTEYSRLILALSAIGKDARDVGGYNLLENYSDLKIVTRQGINGGVYALIAMDTHDYSFPDSGAETPANRDSIISYILGKELAGGGFALFGSTPDPDISSMTLQSLAPYYNTNTDVKACYDRTLAKLSTMQKDHGGFESWGSRNIESVAQVVCALTAIGKNPATDTDFIKNDSTLFNAIMDFSVESGGFSHSVGGGYNSMASNQASYALIAYLRMKNGENSLYDMSDMPLEQPIAGNSLKLVLPSEISGNTDTTFNMQLNVNGWNSADTKLVEAVIEVPAGVLVSAVSASNNLSAGEINYHLSDGLLRFTYMTDSLSTIDITGTLPCDIFVVELKLDSTLAANSMLSFKARSLKLLSASNQPAFEYNTDNAVASVSVLAAGATSAVARQLYAGDGTDLIPSDKKAVAVAFAGLSGTPNITLGSTQLYYSNELSSYHTVPTYVAIINATEQLSDYDVIDSYTIGGNALNVKFADTNSDDTINAQDALNIASAWLRKTAAPDNKGILTMNITADAQINTFDVLAVMEHYVNNADFAVLSK